MSKIEVSPRALLSLLFNGERAVDVLQAAHDLGLLRALERGKPSLRELAQELGARPLRLYKFLDCLESLGLLLREQTTDQLGEARYRAVDGLAEAAEAVLGPQSKERDREKFDWRSIHGRLPEVLRGQHEMPSSSFEWPLRNEEQIAAFEASMTAGLPPIVESFERYGPALFEGWRRVLDVGGGDGSLGAALLEQAPELKLDVFNLPATQPLVEATREARGLEERLGFVAGDFLDDGLPEGYDAMLFVRVLHDWSADTARELLRSAHRSLPPEGQLVICEEFRTPERLAAQFFWSYFLIGVDSCVSRLREVEVYCRMLREVGFREPQVLDGGPFELIVARR